jgi:predicted PurR-regulated permease PerM
LSTQRLRIEIAPRTIFLVLGAVACVWLLGKLADVLAILVSALVLVGTFEPAVAWLGRRGLRRGRALVLTFVLMTLAVVAGVLLMVPPLLAQLLHLAESAPKAREELIGALDGYSWARPLVRALDDLPIDNLSQRATTTLVGYSSHLVVLIGYALSAIFLAIYLLADPVRSQEMLYAAIPQRHHATTQRILCELEVIVGGYMRGQLLTSACIGGFTFVLLTVVGSPDALPIALFVAVTDVIPFVGGYLGGVPVVIAALPHGAIAAAVVAVLMLLYQEFESRILVPRIYGRVLRLPPAIVLLALLVGWTLGGILGAFLALPTAAGVRMLVRELRIPLPGDG